MQRPTSALAGLIRRLDRRSPLADGDRRALEALPYSLRTFSAGAQLIRDGDRPQSCCLLVSGFACRYKITGDGARQILSFHMKGEFVDLHNSLLGIADHSVQALAETEAAVIPRQALRDLAFARPSIAQALWIDTLVDGAIFREWVVNVGRRDSRARVAHLLCELSIRMQAAGLASEHCYELPMTQEQLGDAAGLTSVHINRVLKQLGEERLIHRDRRSIVIHDWQRLRAVGDFNDRYLHESPIDSRPRPLGS
jgi:CRP-like cAMP-binding protein